ncbi:MAG TPA: response regulator [Candidatus Hydrogenedentes bacterium]|nr:response regulator [Candidatus Hydrogenedentota bacterium]HPG70225.1 response regulator [Candidatus Hydrogenedentota bacterium]
MKALIAEDDATSQALLSAYLTPYAQCDVAKDGKEALELFHWALEQGKAYDLVCLDIMMPELDGHAVLKEIRTLEASRGIAGDHATRVIMTTALGASRELFKAFNERCEAYLVKPIDKERFVRELVRLGLI